MDMKKYQSYIKYQAELSRRRLAILINSSYDEEKRYRARKDATSADDDDTPPPLEKKSRKTRGVMAVKTEGGERRIIEPQESAWWTMYVNNVVIREEKHYQDKFRVRFRCPYENYLTLVQDCKEDGNFSRWQGTDCTGKNSSPIELLVLGSLRYLGRGWTFDDLEESTAISKDVHRCFFTPSSTSAVPYCTIVTSSHR
mmetsp:Transcript_18952/g.32615  ORF Transcript_18952/g.32615 Transcript_18952/m.32615 type:complete len:198 (-) Transcript_18952:120-713(-)